VYCACPNEESAATAAKHLKRAGFKKTRPLLGGIDAWIQAGHGIESSGARAVGQSRRIVLLHEPPVAHHNGLPGQCVRPKGGQEERSLSHIIHRSEFPIYRFF
jgi:hypothetical protein